MTKPQTYTIDFEPVGRRVSISADQTVLDAAQQAGVELASICNGEGTCGKCRIQLMTGHLTPLKDDEELFLYDTEVEAGFRLACQCSPLSDLKLNISPESLTASQRLQIEGQEVEIELDPIVLPVDITLQPPGMDDLRSDTTRLNDAFAERGLPSPQIGLPVLSSLAPRLRAQDWQVRFALRIGEIVSVLPPEVPLLGLAVDIGTTKMAAYLVDLSTGETLAKGGATNPQVAYGEDVISRIAYANANPDGRAKLQSELVSRLNELVADLCAQAEADSQQIVESVVVGNTAMHHLFAGLPVRQLGESPYVPSVGEAVALPARHIGLDAAPGSYVYLPPNIAGYVGADHVSMLLASGVANRDETIIALDIGTNTEISLVSEGRLLTCSCASGPAFDGAHIQDGMRAVPGAIERIRIADGVVHTQTVGGRSPVGICGSGILDAVAEMVRAEILTPVGQLQKDHPLVSKVDKNHLLTLVPAFASGHGRPVVVTRKDVNEIQLAKGAIRAGMDVLLDLAGVAYDQVDACVIAGAFGTYLDVESAIRIGMFPPFPLDRFQQIGNAAGMGAKHLLLSQAKRREAEEMLSRIQYIELTTHQNFTSLFAKSIMF